METQKPPPSHIPRQPGQTVSTERVTNFEFPANRPGPTTKKPTNTTTNTRTLGSPTSQQSPNRSAPVQQKIPLAAGHPLNREMNMDAPEEIPMGTSYRRHKEAVLPHPEESVNRVRPQSETDPEYFPVGLPTGFQFYDFKYLSACNLRGVHQAKFARAAKNRKLRYIVEAISSTLGDGISAFDLSPSDFFFVMHWQRINSFPKNPMMIPFTCTNPEHVRKTLLKEDHPDHLSAATLEINEILNHTNLEVTYLPTEFDMSPFQELHDKYELSVETMRDMVEFAELEEENEFRIEEIANKSSEDPEQIAIDVIHAQIRVPEVDSMDELSWLTTRAVFLKRVPGRETIAERVAIVSRMTPDEMSTLDLFIEKSTDCGVLEKANLKCKVCDARHGVPISVDALSFLP